MSAGSVAGHGHSPAAWTTVVILLVAFAIGTFAFWFANVPLVVASAALLVVGGVVGLIMKRLGYGVGGDKLKAKEHV